MSDNFKKIQGFTLVELIVSIAIMLIILSVVLLGQSSYSEGVALRGLADEIELSIRQAQTYGISVRARAPGGGTDNFNIGYGLSFQSANNRNNAYIAFADIGSPKNGIYDSGWDCPAISSSECIEKVPITRNNLIDSICYIQEGDNESCNMARVDISFTRPDTTASIKFLDANGVQQGLPNIKGARINLRSPTGNTNSVVVYVTGQVSIQ
jgi:prepilin-type N-terminal cleavage/methylation domain-containing protein